jgi:hypothetical protein
MPVQGTVNTIDPRCWRWLENCCLRPKVEVPKSSPVPRDNSFDCSLNRHELTDLLFYIHAHNHKSTEDDHVNELNGHWCAWQEWCTAHRSRAWNSSDPETGQQSTVSLRRLFLNFSCNQLKICNMKNICYRLIIPATLAATVICYSLISPSMYMIWLRNDTITNIKEWCLIFIERNISLSGKVWRCQRDNQKHKLNDRYYNGQQNKVKWTNKDLQNTTLKT